MLGSLVTAASTLGSYYGYCGCVIVPVTLTVQYWFTVWLGKLGCHVTLMIIGLYKEEIYGNKHISHTATGWHFDRQATKDDVLDSSNDKRATSSK